MAPTAPPIEGQVWINSDPLTSDHLRGRVVLLVFWSAGCEASLRRLQELEQLSAGRQDGDEDRTLVPIAVHTPRMTCDDDVDRLHRTITRHRVMMPVVHDPHYRTWSRFEPPGWPSTAVIDRRGRITGVAAGCHDIELIAQALEDALDRPLGRRHRDHELEPLPLRPQSSTDGDDDGGQAGPGPFGLRYPEGLAVFGGDSAGSLVALADTGRDRILIGRSDIGHRTYHVDRVITGLDQPAAMAFTGAERLAVIERGGNAVSIINVDSGTRTALDHRFVRPVGLAIDLDGSLVITDAGDDRLHRAIANADHSGHLVQPIAGSGTTGVKAGSADQAELAQPVAVTRTAAGLVFADAASSNLRLLTDRGEVVNITDSDLFDWGLVDGLAHRARLQRPTGLATMADGSVIVVDGGNNRLRRLHQRRLETIGLRGLNDPTAIIALGDKLLVADTGNQQLVAVDPVRQNAWTMAVGGLDRALLVECPPPPEGPVTSQVSSGSATSAT